MGYWLSVYLLLLSVLVNASTLSNSMSSLQPSCHEHEKLALQQFKLSFKIDCSVSVDASSDYAPYPVVESWTGGKNADCCSWDGVECDIETGNVIGLNLSSSCLYGTFPPKSTLFSLTYLKKLVLDFNDFNHSHIPSELGQLGKLERLSLFNAGFSGQVPVEISNLSRLLDLEIGDNSIGSPNNLKLRNPSLENLISNFSGLRKINMVNVDVSSAVPITLTSLDSLTSITLNFCNLYAELPQDIFRLPRLTIVSFAGNQDLVGSLPEFQWHSPLELISFTGTLLSGELPPSIGRLAHLESLALLNCQLSGSIPSSLGNLTKLSALLLRGNNFRGIVPPSISNLTNLKKLSLSDLHVVPEPFVSQLPKLHKLYALGLSGMNIATNIPSLLANVTGLTSLQLTNTQTAGPFPQWLANLTQLSVLSLHGNDLEGPVPQWFQELTNLQLLDLSDNNLSVSFEIFSNFKNLKVLDLSGLNIAFPTKLPTNSSLYNLKFLRLVSCNLTEFPQFLRYQNSLQALELSQNHIMGSVPQWLVNITRESLLTFDLSANALTGFEQPVAVLPWTNLQAFGIRGNKFQGQLPAIPASMQSYDVSANQFTGEILDQFCIARSLIKLDLSNNCLSGHIPHWVGHQLGDSLQLLNLRGNNFQGNIPGHFTSLCNLKMINLSENQLEGALPRSLANCTMLEVLDIGKNRVNDTFPSWLGTLPKLHVLVLSRNMFTGSITYPDSGPQFRSLHIIDLSHNLHTGELPLNYFQNWREMMVSKEDQLDSSKTRIIYFVLHVGVGMYISFNAFEYSITITNKGGETVYPKILNVFRVIDFSSNKFTGRIPDVIGNLKGLQALNLSNNMLEGSIPPLVANMIDLESLDLSWNMLSGHIPPELPQLTSLEVFDVSHNHLAGPVPQGKQFDTFDNSSYEGNSGLCGSPLPKKCKNADAPTLPSLVVDETNEDSELIDWVIRSAGCLSGFIIGYVIGKIFITDKYHELFVKMFRRRPRRPNRRLRRAPRRRS